MTLKNFYQKILKQVFLSVALIIGGTGLFFMIYDRSIPKIPLETTTFLPHEFPIYIPVFASRMQINAFIENKLLLSQAESIYAFYDTLTKSRQITTALLNSALLFEAPVNLIFALSNWESGGFNLKAIGINENATTDHGLMGLNSRTFSSMTKEDFESPLRNAREGVQYLVKEYHRYQETWERALIAYNSGKQDNIRSTTINHLVNVLSFEREFDALFVEHFGH